MTGDIAEDLANVIKNNPDLEKLCLSDNNIGQSIHVILQALKENSRLRILELDGNNICMTGDIAEDLANVIKNNPALEKLLLFNNDLGPSVTVILHASFEKKLHA